MLFMAAFIIIPIAMILTGVPFTWHVIELIPVALVTFFALYGCGMVFAHIGTYVADFKQIISYFLRLAFYLSPVFYDLSDLPASTQDLFWLNPVTSIVQGFRSVLLYGTSPNYLSLLYILAIGLITIPLGYMLLKKYDLSYAKIK
jgi:ABC-type polysaccharide/polyol phosphate export permease